MEFSKNNIFKIEYTPVLGEKASKRKKKDKQFYKIYP